MAKQATANNIEVAPLVDQEVTPIKQTVKNLEPQVMWEIKDRTYILARGMSPLTMTIPSKHTNKHALLFFDEETGVQKEIRYATNQSSVFVEDQKGEATLGHIIFKDGVLTVPKEKQNLQKLLSMYHPLKNRFYNEFKPMEIATEELDVLSLQVDAMTAARSMDIDMAEAIMRVEIGSKVDHMSSKELRRDLLLFARSQPELFLDLASDDNVPLRNFAIKAVEFGIIKLAHDQRTFTWASNGRKLMTVPFDEHPYSAMASFFKTDEGLEIYRSIEKKFS